MKNLLFFALLLTSLAARAASPAVHCEGRSWVHEIWVGPSAGEYFYRQSGFAGGVVSEFAVSLVEGSVQEKSFVFRPLERAFAMRAVADGATKIIGDKKVTLGTGSVFRRDGISNDFIRTCWVDFSLLP